VETTTSATTQSLTSQKKITAPSKTSWHIELIYSTPTNASPTYIPGDRRLLALTGAYSRKGSVANPCYSASSPVVQIMWSGWPYGVEGVSMEKYET
jgi:hypothetical protein